jgi:hypothetical protein
LRSTLNARATDRARNDRDGAAARAMDTSALCACARPDAAGR